MLKVKLYLRIMCEVYHLLSIENSKELLLPFIEIMSFSDMLRNVLLLYLKVFPVVLIDDLYLTVHSRHFLSRNGCPRVAKL